MTEYLKAPLPVGTRVEKSEWRPGDTHAIGARATIVGILGPVTHEVFGELFGYFVVWDDVPDVHVFVAGHRVREVMPD